MERKKTTIPGPGVSYKYYERTMHILGRLYLAPVWSRRIVCLLDLVGAKITIEPFADDSPIKHPENANRNPSA